MEKRKAWVVAVDMGYGHQRAAYPFREIANERIITANSDKLVSPQEKEMWNSAQRFYEGVSRISTIPVIGKPLFGLYDTLQTISPFYPYRDLSRSTIESRYINGLVKRGLCKSIIDYVKKAKIPFLTTFFIPALAANKYGLERIYCVVTDTDISRVWVAPEPKKSKISYFAPTQHTAKRLREYGVPEERIFTTGFPLPRENLGGANLHVLKNDLAERLPNLDPNKTFVSREQDHLERTIGTLKKKSAHTLTLSYMVGGAGAEKEIAADILKSLKKRIAEGTIRLNLVSGTRLEIASYFREQIDALGLSSQLGDGVKIISGISKGEYFENFNSSLHETDILWTKPSEMSFYTALGLPIIIAPPIGRHEVYNKKWLIDMGSGIEEEAPEYVDEWLDDLLESGRLAEAAWQGFSEAPKLGTYEIDRIIFKK